VKDRVYFDRLKYGKELCPMGTAYVLNEAAVTSRCVPCPTCCNECDIDISTTTTSTTVSNTAGTTTVAPFKFRCPAGSTAEGTFFDFQHQICPKCDFRCLTCFEKPTNCRVCASDLRDVTKNCACKSGLIENPTTGECIQGDANTTPQTTCTQPFVWVPIDATTG
jgi:hypothetical protein